jgi:hypothetical protein
VPRVSSGSDDDSQNGGDDDSDGGGDDDNDGGGDDDSGEDDGGDDNKGVESGGGGKSSTHADRENLGDGISLTTATPVPNPLSGMELAKYCALVHAQTKTYSKDDVSLSGMELAYSADVKEYQSEDLENDTYEGSDSETFIQVEETKYFDADENIIIDKLAGLKMSINNTETHQADVSSSSNLCTIAYDDIASLLSIVESGEELFYEKTVTPEVMRNWYQNLLDRVRKMSSGTLSPCNSPQNHDVSSTSFGTVSTKDIFASPLPSSKPEDPCVQSTPNNDGHPNEDFVSPISSELTSEQRVEGSLKPLQDLPKFKNWLPVSFIEDLQNITARDGMISIKMGLLGYLLAYYKSEDSFLEDVFDSTTFRPLGKYRQDVNICFNYGGHNKFYVNHDLFIISSLLQIYVKSHKEFNGDQTSMIEYIMEALKSYQRPFLSLLSHSTKSDYESIDPNGFCAYLAAATSYQFATQIKNPHNMSLETLKVRISIL